MNPATRTEPLQNPAPGAGGTEDTTEETPTGATTVAEPARTRHLIQGDPDAGRALTLDFDRLIGDLLDSPDPDPEDTQGYGPGVDLLIALRNGDAEFGRAAPDVDPNATIADAVLGITDEALDAAERFIVATSDDQPMWEQQPTPQLCALMLEIGEFSITRETDAIRNLPPAVDSAIANDVDGTSQGGAFF